MLVVISATMSMITVNKNPRRNSLSLIVFIPSKEWFGWEIGARALSPMGMH